MIGNNEELQVTLERIERFQQQAAQLRRVETNPTNYRLSVNGYLGGGSRLPRSPRESHRAGESKGVEFAPCLSCGCDSMRIRPIAGPLVSAKCVVCTIYLHLFRVPCPNCSNSVTLLSAPIAFVCNNCSTAIGGDYLLNKYAPPPDSSEAVSDAERAVCGECWKESVVLFDDTWVCLACCAFTEEEAWVCERCGRKITGERDGPDCLPCDVEDELYAPQTFGGIM